MTEPKFLRTRAVQPKKNKGGRSPISVTGKKSKAQVYRDARPQTKLIPRAVKPVEAPTAALATLSDAWRSAQAAQLAGTPVDSPIGQLILEQIERAEEPQGRDVVEFTGNLQDDLVGQHRVDIAETRRLVMGLIAELDAAITMHELFEVIADVCNPVDEDGEMTHKINKLRQAFHDLISLPSRTDLALKLSNSLRALIPLERQAAGLPDGYVDAATERAKKEAAATVTMVQATSFDAIKGRFEQILMAVKKPVAVAT